MTASVPEASNQGIEQSRGRAAFSRSARLLRHADFERVYKQGKRHFSASMTFFFFDRRAAGSNKVPATPGMRVGFTVGRALGGAVQRNRMKRRLREAVRLARLVPGLNADVVINPKKVLLTTSFEAVLNEVSQAFVVIERKLGRSSAEAARDQPNAGGRTPEAGSR